MNAVAPTCPKRSIVNPRGEGEEPEGGTGDAITQFAPLGELVSLISSGSTPLGGASNYSAAGEVMLIRSQNVHMRQLVLDDVAFVSRRTADVMARTYLARGDVLLNITGASIGRSALFDLHTTANVNQHVCVIRPKPDCLDARYLVSFLASPAMQRRIMSQQNGGTRQALTFSQIAAFEVPLRPLPEQRRIADILDKADAIRRKRKEAIALTEELLRSTFLDMFGDPVTNPKGWEVKALGDVADVAGGLQVTSARSGNPISMPYLRVANVYRDRLELSEVKDIRVTEAERARATLKHGDVLVVEGHGNPEELGRAAVWRDEIAGCAHQNHLIRVRVTPGILDATFLSAFLNSSSGKKQMLALGKTTSGLNTISTNNVRSVRIVVPPLERQVKYAEVVGGIGKLRGTMQRRSARDENLFNALVSRAFSGSLGDPC